MADSGVPKHGEPDCMSMFERNDPKMTGHPGLMSWARAIPDSASRYLSTIFNDPWMREHGFLEEIPEPGEAPP